MFEFIKNNVFHFFARPQSLLWGLSIFSTINNIFTSSRGCNVNKEQICTKCDYRTESDDKFCSQCGGELQPTTEVEAINTPTETPSQDTQVEGFNSESANTEGANKEWYDTGWAWGWIILFWPVAVFAFYHRNGGEYKEKMIIGFVILAIIGVVTPDPSDESITTLSKGRADKACFNKYLNSNLMARGSDVDYQRQITVKTGENEYSSVIYYKLDGFSRGFNCESIYLKDGKVWVSVYN